MVIVYMAQTLERIREFSLENLRIVLGNRSREYDTVARFHGNGEETRNEKVFLAVEAAAHLIGICHAIVPVRQRLELSLGAELHVQIREIFIKSERNSVVDLLAVGHSLRILAGQAMHASECEERFQHEGSLFRGLDEMILDEYLIGVRSHKNSLAEQDFPYLVDNLRGWIGIEIDYVLMTSRFIDISVAVDAEIELLAAYDKTFVQGRQKDEIPPSKLIDRNCKKSMVTPGIASHDGCVAIGSCLVRHDDLSFERIFQVYQF